MSSAGPTQIGPGSRDASALDARHAATAVGLLTYTWDLATDAIAWGPNAAEVLGPGDWDTGAAFGAAVEPAHGVSRADAIGGGPERDEGTGVRYAALYGLRLPSGVLITVDDTGRWFADAAGQPAIARGAMRLRRAGPEDLETARARATFLAQVESDVAEAKASGRPLTIFVFSLSNLSDLNESLGFEAADGVIETVLTRLCGTLRLRDRFARYGGNRFALALRGCGGQEARIAAERMCAIVAADPVGSARGPVYVRLAIGGATSPDHALEAATLLRRAEASLGLSKRRLGSPFLMYEPGLFRAAPRDRREPLLESVEALNARRIALASQPVVQAISREVAFGEALIRLQTPDGRFCPAGDVIPALERAGLVHLADARVLELVGERLRQRPGERLAFNVSPLSLDRPDWHAALRVTLDGPGEIASRLIVEITETAIIRDPAATRRVLDGVKSLGARVAIDDFGAGHTSFRNLRDFPIDYVKIDGAFVQNLARSADDRFFVRTLVDLARHLGVQTVAEWVEDEDSARLLASWGVDYLQGDHLGRPEIVSPNPGFRTSRVA